MPDWLRHAISSLEHYPWLKPVVMMLSALLLIVVLGGSFAYRELLRLQLAPLETRQAELVSQTIASISRELGHIRNLTHVLKNSLRVQRALQVDQPPQLTQLGEDFIRFSQASPVISQLRWLDRNGNERVRVNIRNGHAQIVSQDALQNKATYYYFQQALRTPADRVYTSPIDLNVEQGRIVTPFQPTLRATILTGEEDGLQPGVLIINFNLAPFFERLRALADNNTHVELLDPSGYWLLHPDRQQEWGFQLGHPELTLAETASPLWTALHAAHFAGSLRYQQRLVSFARLNHDESSDRAGTAEDHLFVMAVSRSGQINELRYRLLLPIILVCSAIFAVGLILIRYFVRGVQERHHRGVDQQVDLVAPQQRRLGEPLHRHVVRDALERLDRVRREARGHLLVEVLHLVLARLPRLDVSLEAAAPQDEVHREGEVGKRVQADAPGDRALGGARGHHRVDRSEEPEKVEQHDERRQHSPSPLSRVPRPAPRAVRRHGGASLGGRRDLSIRFLSIVRVDG